MTASTATPSRRASWRARVRHRSSEAVVFSAAAVLALAHAFDDALLLPGAGVPLTRHALALAIAVAATVAAIVSFDSMRAGARALTAFTFGVLAAVNGGRHAHHIIYDGTTTANDVTGVLALFARHTLSDETLRALESVDRPDLRADRRDSELRQLLVVDVLGGLSAAVQRVVGRLPRLVRESGRHDAVRKVQCAPCPCRARRVVIDPPLTTASRAARCQARCQMP